MGKALSRGRLPRVRRSAIWAVAATTAVSLAGCGSSGGSASSGSGEADVAQAKSMVAKYEAAMTSFALPPLKTQPPSGKRVAVVTNNIPESLDLLAGVKDGAKALGWTPVPIVYDPTSATGLPNAYAQAVEENPDGVVTLAVDTKAYAKAASQMAEKNIPLVTSNTPDAITPPVIANVANAKQYELLGRIVANYVVARKGADANVAMFNIPSFPILEVYEKAFKSEYLRLCPACKYKSVPVQAGDIGTKVPAQVASAVQVDPTINFAVMGFGAVATGVSAALKAAGNSEAKIVGINPSMQNMTGLISGSEDMWVGYPLRGVGWKSIDALARHMNGEDTAASTAAATPFQILTKANVAEPAALPEVKGYQDYFKKLWHVD